MTDSKTPDWAKAVDRAIGRLQGLDDYAGRPAWESILREELEAAHSKALSAVDQRAYARGIEEAAKVATGGVDQYRSDPWAKGYRCAAADIEEAIRQLLEVKG